MSFLKKLAKEFEDFTSSFDDKKKEESSSYATPPQYQHQDQQQTYHQSSLPVNQDPRSYVDPSHSFQERQNYSQGEHVPSHEQLQAPPNHLPPLPVGWIQQFDSNYRRWFYVYPESGQTQWERPFSQYNQETRRDVDYNSFEGNTSYAKKKKSGHGGLLLGAAGGLAVGAVGGAMLAHALGDSSDDESRGLAYNSQGAAPQGLPPVDNDGNSISSSDRESVEEARENYEKALRKANDSDASSSDIEEAREAYEEYQEEYEEAYDD